MVAAFSLLKLWMARVIGQTIDGLIETKAVAEAGTTLLRDGVLLMTGIVIVESVCRFFARRWIIDSSRHVEAQLKLDLMQRMGRLPLTWYERSQTGDILSRMTQDVELMRFLVGPCILYGCQVLVTIPVGFYVMMQLSSTVALAILGAFGTLLVAMLVLLPQLQVYSKRVQEDIADISQFAQESFSGIRVILNFAKAQGFSQRLAHLNQKYVNDNMVMTRFRALVNLFVHFCTDLVLLFVMVFGGIEVIEGRMTPGDLFQFLVVMGMLVWPLIAAGWILGVIHRARAAADRVEEVLTATTETQGGKVTQLAGAISVRDLTFCYPGETEPSLEGIHFELEPGAKLGLVGPVGSGKSTLMHLLLRLYDPPRGSIFVDGHDILDIDLPSLRQLFAYAPQEPFLFSDTVGDNVRFGTTESGHDNENVEAAVRSAALDQDIESLAEGLETIVGERGVSLSGGQKQRVSLARALIGDRQVVVLDDTLSAVDHHTESLILSRLQRATGGRSLIIASHRLSAVMDADLILVLRKGRNRRIWRPFDFAPATRSLRPDVHAATTGPCPWRRRLAQWYDSEATKRSASITPSI